MKCYKVNTSTKLFIPESKVPHLMHISLYASTRSIPYEHNRVSARQRHPPTRPSDADSTTAIALLCSPSPYLPWLNENCSRRSTRHSRRLQKAFRHSKAYSTKYSKLPMHLRKISWRTLSSEKSRSSNGIEIRLKRGPQVMR